MNYNNPHERKLDQIAKAKKLWLESEWALEFLRSEGNPVHEPTDEELLQWMHKLHLTQQT
jgi:hypothetical protein